jgi:glycosyltransferase involved in cell wall biosynthesis
MRPLVIVPAFNEAKNLPAVAEGLRRHAPGVDVVVVDDGSTDATSAVATSLGLRVLRLPVNLGIGGAVQTGYLWAATHGHDAAVQLDGDGQHDPADLEALLAPIARGEADLVIGSRFLTREGFQSTGARRVGIRWLSLLLRLRAGARVTDPTSGLRAAGPRAIALFARSYPSDYPEPEAISLASRAGLALAEVPARMRARAHGASSIRGLLAPWYIIRVSFGLLWPPARQPQLGPAEAEPSRRPTP